MNLVEVWFGIIERQAIHRGTFTSVSELVGKICGLINELERPVPPVRLDQNHRANPQEGEPTNDFNHRPLDAN